MLNPIQTRPVLQVNGPVAESPAIALPPTPTATPVDRVDSPSQAGLPTPSVLASVPSPAPSLADAAVSLSSSTGAATIGGAIGQALGKLAAGAAFVGFGVVYKTEEALTHLLEKIHRPLDALPTPRIEVPYVMVPGWTTQPEAFLPLVEHLTRDGANGGQTYYVKQGAFYTLDKAGEFQPAPSVGRDAKVFEMAFSDPRQSPTHNVEEMRANFAAISQVTGESKFDVEGYSMGGIDSRLYLDQGGTAMRRLLLLGTPNQGTEFANMATNVLEKKVGWAAAFGGLVPTDTEALEWLRPEQQSPPLHDLNSRWDAQRKAVPIVTVGTDVLPTPARDKSVTGFADGDGMVDAASLKMPGNETIVLNNAMQHGRLNDDETVEHIRSLFFGWRLGPEEATAFPSDDREVLLSVPRPPSSASEPT